MKLVQSYACNIYGSNIWNLFSPECQKLFTSYNVALRTILKLPRTTHRYVLENMTDIPHLYVQLLSRYVTFTRSLLSSSFPVRFLSRLCVSDLRTVMGRSLLKIAELCGNVNGIMNITARDVKKKVRYAAIPSEEIWRIGMISDLRSMLNMDIENMTDLSQDEMTALLEHACCS